MTLFPEAVAASLKTSILGRAEKKGLLDIRCVQIRDYTENKQQQVDDYPYGGGWGCVMMAQPLKSCLDAVCSDAGERKRRVIYLSPQRQTLDPPAHRRTAPDYDHLVLVCGHYEGVDERFIEACVDEELSLGDFVLTGGEIAAMAVADAVCRLVPGVLSDEECFTGESHWDGLLEYPQYTRPETWEGRAVPEVLRGGNDALIRRWRRKKMLERTMDKRPDLWEKRHLSEEDEALLSELMKERSRLRLTEPVECRKVTEADMEAVDLIFRQARNSLKKHRVDQWQGEYPNADAARADMERGEGYVMTYGGRTAAYFCLSPRPEPTYAGLTDGKWSREGDYCVIHRSAVGSEFRGTGMADRMFAAAEELTRAMGVEDLRVDTHRHNEPMKALLRRRGFKYRGNILVHIEEGHDPRRQAFEKVLK
jgi:tRNA (guanine-N1)-methyltransferase